MKRFSIISLVLIFAVVLSAFSVSAADSYELIYKDADWRNNDNQGASVTIDFSSGDAVFSGSLPGTWPDIACNYAPDKQIKVNVNEYSLAYDFTVENGQTNISLRFLNADGITMSFPIANNTLGDVNYDSGSGDLQVGDYKGVIKLSDFVNAKTFLDNSAFDKSYINADNEIIFSGIQVYSVGGGKITVRELDIIKNGSKTEEPAESSEPVEESAEDVVESSSPEAESSEVIADESSEETVDSSEIEVSEIPTESESSVEDEESDSDANAPATGSDSDADASTGSISMLGVIVLSIGGVLLLAGIIVVIIIVSKKKK